MTELVIACGNLRSLIGFVEEAIAFGLPLEQIPNIGLRTQYAEAFLNSLNEELAN